jgi:Circadian oscillating protein COP23
MATQSLVCKLSLSVALLASSVLPAFAAPVISQAPPSRNPSTSTPVPAEAVNARFSCNTDNGEYTVVYNPQSQPGTTYPWAKPTAMGGGWSADRRCVEISRRLEEYRPAGLLEMQTAVENGYNTICVTTSQVPTCRIVLTVPEGEDPLVIRDRVFGNLTVADSGRQTTAVTTFSGDDSDIINQVGVAIGIDLSSLGRSNRSSRDRSSNSPDSINLRPFLDPADGGTGTRLR